MTPFAWTMLATAILIGSIAAWQAHDARKRRRWEEMKRAKGRSVRPIKGPNDHWGSE